MSNSKVPVPTKFIPAPSKIPLPTKFQPIVVRSFLLEIPGIDCFFVKSVERPPYIRPRQQWSRVKQDWELLDEHLANKKLVVVLHNSIAPSTEQQVQELINKPEAELEVKIKFLDPVGNVIGLRVFKRVKLERVDYDVLTYDSTKELSEIKLTLSFNSETLLF